MINFNNLKSHFSGGDGGGLEAQLDMESLVKRQDTASRLSEDSEESEQIAQANHIAKVTGTHKKATGPKQSGNQ